MSRKNVQNAHISDEMLHRIYTSIVDIVMLINQPQRDEVLIKKAGIQLDRVLFPLFVGINHFGPIGVVELASNIGRDYSTVSRQLSRLQKLGLIERREGVKDKRVSEVNISSEGKKMINHINNARKDFGQMIFEEWDSRDIEEFIRLLQKFTNSVKHKDIE